VISRRCLLVALTTNVMLGTPRASRAQSGGRLPRVVLFTFTPELKDSFVAGLREFGWVEGQNVIVDWRRTPTPRERERELETEVARKPDVLVLANPVTIAAGIRKTTTVPIVGIDLESDPVAARFVVSLARPGGNVTGIWLDLPELAGKLVQLLREAMPRLPTAGVLWDDRVGRPQLQTAQEAGRAVGLNLAAISVANEIDVDRAIERIARDGARASRAVCAGAQPKPRAHRPARDKAPSSLGGPIAALRGGRWSDRLRPQPARHVSPCRPARRSDSPRRTSARLANRASGDVRVGCQHEYSEGLGLRRPPIVTRPGEPACRIVVIYAGDVSRGSRAQHVGKRPRVVLFVTTPASRDASSRGYGSWAGRQRGGADRTWGYG